MKATIYKTDGTREVVESKNKKFSLKELQDLVGGLIAVVNLEKFDLIVNDEGILLNMPYNLFTNLLIRDTIWEGAKLFGDIVKLDGKLD